MIQTDLISNASLRNASSSSSLSSAGKAAEEFEACSELEVLILAFDCCCVFGLDGWLDVDGDLFPS